MPQKRFSECVVFTTHWGCGLYSLPRQSDCTPTLTSSLTCLATQSLRLGTCTQISSLSTTKNCFPVGRPQLRSFYARQLWVSFSRRKLCLIFSTFSHKVWNTFPFPLLVKSVNKVLFWRCFSSFMPLQCPFSFLGD